MSQRSIFDTERWQKFGRWLREVRVRRGLTQGELAELIGLSLQHYNKIETGTTGTRRATVQRLAVALEVGIAQAYEKAGLQLLDAAPSASDASPGPDGPLSDAKRPLTDAGALEPATPTADVEQAARDLAEAISTQFRGQAEILVEQFAHQLNTMVAEAARRYLKKYSTEILNRANEDALTGLSNRLVFHEILQREFVLAQRYQVPLSLLLLDVDHFKGYNDENGHAEGDRLLQNLAQALKQQARRTDTVARLGGGEFGIILPHTYGDAADVLARRYRTNVKKAAWNGAGITVSIGVGVITSAMRAPNDLVQSADEALWKAKAGGRDRAVLHKEDDLQGEEAAAPM